MAPARTNYRQTFNNNLVLIVMIETIEGVKNAAEIAKVPGVHGVFAASGDLGNFSGWAQGDPEYERLINGHPRRDDDGRQAPVRSGGMAEPAAGCGAASGLHLLPELTLAVAASRHRDA